MRFVARGVNLEALLRDVDALERYVYRAVDAQAADEALASL